jgi:hypothetical protein
MSSGDKAISNDFQQNWGEKFTKILTNLTFTTDKNH